MQNRGAARQTAWLSLGQAALYLGVSEPTLRKWTDNGRLSVFRTPGGHRRYRRSELDRFRAESLEQRAGAD